MHPESRFWIWTLVIVIGIPLLVGGQTTLFVYLNAAELAWIPEELRGTLLLFLLIAVLSGMPVLIFVLRHFFNIYVFPMHRFAEDVEAALHGYPSARLHLDDNRDLLKITDSLNELLLKDEELQKTFENRLSDALSELSEEKKLLESILDALTEGVVVCTLEGEVVQYNHAAQKLLDSQRYLGAGVSIHDIFDRTLIHYGMERIREELITGVEHPFTHFIVNLGKEPQTQYLVRIAPIFGLEKKMEGFVLTFDALQEFLQFPLPEETKPVPPNISMIQPGEKWENMLLSNLQFVVFDTETTGLEPSEGDEIISLAAVRIVNGKILKNETFDQLVDPLRPISPASFRVHGITEEKVRGKPTIGIVLEQFARFADGAVLVAHNAAFDMKFLKLKEKETGIVFNQPVLDTMLLSSLIHPHQESHALDSLIKRYGLPQENRHSALADSLVTAELFIKLLPQLKSREIILLKQALEASKKVPLASITF